MTRRTVLGIPAFGVVVDGLLNSAEFLMLLGAEMYTPLAVMTGWVAPEVSFLNQEYLALLTVAAATLYVLHLLSNINYDRLTDRLD